MLLREVLDKGASIPVLLAQAVALAAIGYALTRRWRWAALAPLLLASVMLWGTVEMYREANVGPAVWREGGVAQLAAQLAAPIAAIVSVVVALRSRPRAG